MSKPTKRRALRTDNLNSPKGRKPYRVPMNDEETEDSETEDIEEMVDETDRNINVSKRKKHEYGECFEEESSSLDTIFDKPRTNCERTIITSTKRKDYIRYNLYPNLKDSKNELQGGAIKNKKGGFAPIVLIVSVFLLILFMFIFFNLYKKNVSEPTAKKSLDEIHDNLMESFAELRTRAQQPRKFWIQVYAQLKLLVEEFPPQPAILLAVVPLDSQKTAACLIQRFLESVSLGFEDPNYASFDVLSHLDINESVVKHIIDDTMKKLENSHAVGIYNIEKLHPKAAKIFHGYCDNENAPFKRSLILLTMGIDLPYSSIDLERLDSVVYKHLMERWEKNLRDVDSAAIISRIANTPIAFKPLENSVIGSLCPY